MPDIEFYCINLVTATKRRQWLVERVRELGMNMTFVEAVIGQKLTYDTAVQKGYLRQRRRQMKLDLELNEIACLLSHRKVLEEFLSSSGQYAVVLEDDVDFSDHLENGLNELIDHYIGWDAVKLENRLKKIKGPVVSFDDEMSVFVPLRPGFGTAAILYSRSGAKRTLNAIVHFDKAFDTQFLDGWRYGLKMLQVYPALVWEREVDESTISGRDRTTLQPGWIPYVRFRINRLTQSIVKRMYARRVHWAIKVLPQADE